MQDDGNSMVRIVAASPFEVDEGVEVFVAGTGGKSYRIWRRSERDGLVYPTPLAETLGECVEYLRNNDQLVGFVRRQNDRIEKMDLAALQAQQRLDALVQAVLEISRPDSEQDVAARMARLHKAFSGIVEKTEPGLEGYPVVNGKPQNQAVRQAIRTLREKPDLSMTPVRTKAFYSVEVPEDDFLAVTGYEDALLGQQGFETILDRLERIDGVYNIEYNGHFGSAIHFALEDEFAHRMPDVIEAIKAGIEAAREYGAPPEAQP